MGDDRKFQRLFIFELVLAIGCVGAISGAIRQYMLQGNIKDQSLLLLSGVALVLVVGWLLTRRSLRKSVEIMASQLRYGDYDALLTLYKQSPLAYLTIKSGGTIIDCNAAATHLLNGTLDTVPGNNFFTLVSDETSSALMLGKTSSGLVTKDVEVPLRILTGQSVWVSVSIFKYRGSQEFLVSLTDVTDKKRVDTAKSEFVALATHQLRTPIAAIRWNTELLERKLRGVATDDHRRYLEKIERNVLRMIALINDFLSVSKLEMGTFESKVEEINLTEYITGVLDEYAEKITEKQIVIQRHEDPPGLTISIDSRLVHIIISNLLSNAVKYTRAQGTVAVSYQERDGKLQLVVADSGIGIPADELDKLFTKFYRASNAQSHQTEGTGLGLYVVKQSVELLGGEIKVQSETDQGAQFIVLIPVTVLGRG